MGLFDKISKKVQDMASSGYTQPGGMMNESTILGINVVEADQVYTAKLERLMADGERCKATIKDVNTGMGTMQYNGKQLCVAVLMTMHLPTGDQDYGITNAMLPISQIPSVGAVVEVAYNPNEPWDAAVLL